MKKIITCITFVLFACSSMSQTLQTVTNNGNTTTLGIKVATLALDGATLSANVPLNINTVPNGMSAFFGNDQNAVAIGNRFPDIYFNGYFDGATYRSVGAGFSGLLRYDNSSGNLDYYSTAFATIGVGTPVTYSNPFNIYGTGSMYCSGQGRFSGWYNSGESTSPAAEIGFDGTQATLLGYDRSNLKYFPLRLVGGNTGTNINFIQIDNSGFSFYNKNFLKQAGIDSAGNGNFDALTTIGNISAIGGNFLVSQDPTHVYLQSYSSKPLYINQLGNNIILASGALSINGASGAITGTSASFSGNVGIGTTNPQSKLAVNGVVTAQQVTVTQTGWADYVFNKTYQLRPLSEIEEYIHRRKHLPGIPSETEIESKGLNVGDMEQKQMQKIEELTLYVIELDKKNAEQDRLIRQLTKENQRLEKKLSELASTSRISKHNNPKQ